MAEGYEEGRKFYIIFPYGRGNNYFVGEQLNTWMDIMWVPLWVDLKNNYYYSSGSVFMVRSYEHHGRSCPTIDILIIRQYRYSVVCLKIILIPQIQRKN